LNDKNGDEKNQLKILNDFQKKLKDIQIEHQDEILRYKGKLTTLEYELKSKNSQIELIANKLRKTEQEQEILRARVEHFEVH
jgi:hypothetical protein